MSLRSLEKAESGEALLTLIQARKAAAVYERPFVVLFLPAPPEEDPPEVQFRRLRDAPALPWAPPMRVLAREVPALQDEADALFEALEEHPRWPDAAGIFAREPDPERLGAAVRQLVGVSVQLQKAAARTDPQGFRAFRVWREAIEQLGVLVLQDGTLPLEEMRGFAVPHRRVPALVINSNDDVRARLFTMLHEFAHLFWTGREESRYEEFAAAALMPRDEFARDFHAAAGRTLLEKVDALARQYATTPDATAVRVGWLQIASWEVIREVRAEIRERGGRGSRASGGTHYRNIVARLGPQFVTRVLGAVETSAMSELAAARLLGIRVERFDELRRELSGAREVA